MLEDNGMKQSQLVGPVFASPGIVSEILSGKRQLTLSHIQKLAAFSTPPLRFSVRSSTEYLKSSDPR